MYLPFISFFVAGKAEPQGSSRAFVRNGRAVVTSDNPKLKGWRKAVAGEAKAAMGEREPLAGPVSVEATFFMERPKSMWKKKTQDLRLPCSVIPDVDKLSRGLLDALAEGGVYANDSRVSELSATKYWRSRIDEPGVLVVIRRWED